MFPMDRKPDPIIVEYTSRNRRVEKQFKDLFAARRFYATKLKQGKNPTIKKGT